MAGPAVLPREAIAFLRAKGLKPSRHWLSVWREEHASAFAVAQMTRQDLLRQTHRELQRVLRKGETFESFQERLQPWLQEKGWAPTGRGGDIPKRLRRIYHTNLRTAHLAGQWDRIQRTKQLLPWLVYGLGPSEVHREQHAAWAGLCLRVDDPFWRTHMPPNGWGCKCWVRQVAEPPAGATTKAPRVETRPWTNPATGETVHVPRGIDPGWDYNAAEHAGLGTVQALTDRVQRLAAPPAFPQARLDDLEGRLQAAQRKYRERYSPDDKPAIDRAAADYRRAWDALPEPVLSADSGAGRAARRRARGILDDYTKDAKGGAMARARRAMEDLTQRSRPVNRDWSERVELREPRYRGAVDDVSRMVDPVLLRRGRVRAARGAEAQDTRGWADRDAPRPDSTVHLPDHAFIRKSKGGSASESPTIPHELGHAVENANDALFREAVAFLDRRHQGPDAPTARLRSHGALPAGLWGGGQTEGRGVCRQDLRRRLPGRRRAPGRERSSLRAPRRRRAHRGDGGDLDGPRADARGSAGVRH